MNYYVAFYGAVKSCFVGKWQAKNYHIVYDNRDQEEILLAVLKQQQKLYAKEGQYDIIGNTKSYTTTMIITIINYKEG